MTSRKPPVSSYRPIKLKTAKEQRVPYRVPDPPKFTDVPGQLAMDLSSGDPDALTAPKELTA